MSASDEDDRDATSSYGKWGRRICSCRDRVARVAPLNSIKIVLVAWQIVTQVRAEYPELLSIPDGAIPGGVQTPQRVLAGYLLLDRPSLTVGDEYLRGT